MLDKTDDQQLDKTDDQQQEESRLCSECGCSFSPPQLDSHSDSESAKQKQTDSRDAPFKCPSCEAGGSSSPPNGRRAHRHIRLDPHSCSICNKTFISSAHLSLHLTSHNKERKFRCNICGKFFHQSSHLMAHKVIHSGDKPFKCPECGKNFGRASHLKTHRRLHTGEKPFKCTYCSKSFTQKAGLLAHIRLHTGERPYKCEQCGAGFRSMSTLLSHKALEAAGPVPAVISTPAPPVIKPHEAQSNMVDLKCGVCCRTFVRSSYIRLHIRLKKGQRPYHCKVCNKTFVKLETFVNHCDKHLKQKKEKNCVKYEVVKPPQFVPLSRPSSPESLPKQELTSEMNTHVTIKTEHDV
ncbi:zinc finger protein 723 [Poeciliopsis prolifica]|uniref:zinc finger protein 723 n=1 Tax=Poeciliopsis prolifica TaxID=188132 RepID=UPI0024137038|nr:zinc finger protein 723 [Poeciliopsis prolifica]